MRRVFGIALAGATVATLITASPAHAAATLPPPSVNPTGNPWSGTLTKNESWSGDSFSWMVFSEGSGWDCTGSKAERFTTNGMGLEDVAGIGRLPFFLEISVEENCHRDYFYVDDNGTGHECSATASVTATGSAAIPLSDGELWVNYQPEGYWSFMGSTVTWVPPAALSLSDPCGKIGFIQLLPLVVDSGYDPNPGPAPDTLTVGTRLTGSHGESWSEAGDTISRQWSWDFIYYGMPAPPGAQWKERGTGDVGSTCGRAKFRWYTIAHHASFIRANDQACSMMLSNKLAREALSVAYSEDQTLTEVFGGEMSHLLAQDIAEEVAKDELESHGWALAARLFPRAANFLKATNFYGLAAEVSGYNAIALETFFVINQIQNKGACIQLNLDIDDGVLKVDWHLVYNPSSLKYPVRDAELTIASLWRREERSLRPDLFHRKQLNLSCTPRGRVEVRAKTARDTSEVFTGAKSGVVINP